MTNGQGSEAVATFMAALAHPQKPAIAHLRALILSLSPAVREQVKWNAPSFGLGTADQITFQLRGKPGVRLILHRGVKLIPSDTFAFPDPAQLLTWAARDRAILSVRDLADVQAREPALRDVLARWLEATRPAAA